MMEYWSEPGFTKRGRGRMGIMGGLGTWLGVIFVILAVVGEAMDTTIGFEPMFWLTLAIASLLFGLTCWIGWAVGLYFHVKETGGK
jgi:hypothetical protein